MTAKPRGEAGTASRQRYELACGLVKSERQHRKKTSADFGEAVGLSYSTVSAIEGGKRDVSEETWDVLAISLGWGKFLEFVFNGEVDLVKDKRFGDVRQELRDYAVLRLEQIATPAADTA